MATSLGWSRVTQKMTFTITHSPTHLMIEHVDMGCIDYLYALFVLMIHELMKLLFFSKYTVPWSRQPPHRTVLSSDNPETWKADHDTLEEENMKHSTTSEHISLGYSMLVVLGTLLSGVSPIFPGLKEPGDWLFRERTLENHQDVWSQWIRDCSCQLLPGAFI